MIKPRDVIADLERTVVPDIDRSRFLRLDRNELVPHLGEEVFRDVVASLTPDSFSAYPAVWPLYEELAASLGVGTDQLLLGAGSDWLIRACFDTFVEEDAEVVLPIPTYGMYAVYATLRGASLTALEHGEGFQPPLEEIRRALTRRPRLLALANPNGALGVHLGTAELLDLLDRAAASDTLVVIDEAYVEYADAGLLAHLDRYENLLLVRTFSKACGLAGLRVGYAVGPPHLIGWLQRVRPNVEINQVAVAAGLHLLRNPHIIEGHVASGLEGKCVLAKRLRAQGFEVFEGAANFLQVRLGERHAKAHQSLAAAGVHVKDQTGTGITDGWTRITVGPPDAMNTVADIIERGLS